MPDNGMSSLVAGGPASPVQGNRMGSYLAPCDPVVACRTERECEHSSSGSSVDACNALHLKR